MSLPGAAVAAVVEATPGAIMAIDTPAGITRAFQHPLYAVNASNMYQLINDLRTFEGAADCYAFGEYAHLKLQGGNWNEKDIRQFLESKGHTNIEVKTTEASVEDCFIELMKA